MNGNETHLSCRLKGGRASKSAKETAGLDRVRVLVPCHGAIVGGIRHTWLPMWGHTLACMALVL